jgi:hypothetical protein
MNLLKFAFLAPLFLLALYAVDPKSAPDDPQAETPFIKSVDPGEAKPLEVILATGLALDRTHAADLFLTDGKEDYRVEILEQAFGRIKFKVAGSTPPGRYRLMVLTTKTSMLIEQPAFLTVK